MRANDAEQVGAVQPALTPGEWERRSGGVSVGDPHNVAYLHDTRLTADGMFEGRERHALAALALHGQPFGFRREHVHAIGYFLAIDTTGDPIDADEWQRNLDLASEAQKLLAALLPPE